MGRCPHCAAELQTPLACSACESLLAPAGEPTPYEVLGLPIGFRVEAADLRRRLLRFSRLTHPDYFGNEAPAVRELAEENSARVNAAYDILSDDAARADWLVRHLGGPDENGERAMPQAFLLEVLEWNEVLEEARNAGAGEPVQARLPALEATLRENRADALAAIASLLDPVPERGSAPLRDARRQLNAIRYLDRALAELEALRLMRAATR